MLNVDAVERQLNIPTHGLARRKELLRRAQARFDRELAASAAMYLESGKTLVALMDQRQRLADLNARYGVERGKAPDGSTTQYERAVEVIVTDGRLEVMAMDDLIIRTPLQHVGPYELSEPLALSGSEAKALSHLDRGLLVPGYIALCALA